MAGKKLNFGGGGGHGDDLMITPLLDLLVALLPFLIMSSVMMRIHVAEVGISKPVAQAVSKPESTFDLAIKVSDKSADLVLKGKVIKSIARTGDTKWTHDLHAELVQLKKQNLDEFKIRIEPAQSVTLDSLMGLMDAVRSVRPEDGEIIRKDETGKAVKLQYLFPNIILRGVYS